MSPHRGARAGHETAADGNLGDGTSTLSFSMSSSGASNRCVEPSRLGWGSSYRSWPPERSVNLSEARVAGGACATRPVAPSPFVNNAR
jgi:hypothetical protein